jgi:hypothetical protein
VRDVVVREPEIVGPAVFFGAEPVALTAAVGRETATPEPLLFDAVTWPRRRLPTSAVAVPVPFELHVPVL